MPNKLFKYLYAGLPVIVSDLVELGPFVREGGVGRVVAGEGASAVVDAVLAMNATDLRSFATAEAAAAHKYNWRTQADRLASLFEALGFGRELAGAAGRKVVTC